MRMLVMVSNNHMTLREIYTLAVENHRAGWATSFMSGLPAGADSIVAGFDAVVYELGAPADLDRVAAVKSLLGVGARVITHVEGRDADARADELRAVGAQVVAHPVTPAGVDAALDVLAAQSKGKTDRKRVGFGERIRRTFTG
jgi:hypothetical protein